MRRVHEAVGYEAPYEVGMLSLTSEIRLLGPTPHLAVYYLQVIGTSDQNWKIQDQYYPVPFALESGRRMAVHVLHKADHPHGRGRVDGAAVRLVIQANVAA